MAGLTSKEIERLLEKLNEKLSKEDSAGELYLVGGAVRCLVHKARPATKDLDGFFKPSALIRKLAAQLAEEENIAMNWLNDAVKGYLSPAGSFESYLSFNNLKVYCARADYLLALKCLAMRIGEEFYDLADVQFLIRALNLEGYDQVLAVITRYFPLERFPQKTLYVLEELLAKST